MARPESPEAGKRKRLSGPERRASIIAAAREVFLEQGFSGARTRAIAERAEITEAVLYRHFSSKEEIFEAAVLLPLVDGLEDFLNQSRDVLAARGSAAQRVGALQAVWLQHMAELVPLLGVALFSDQASGRLFYRERVAPVLDALRDEMAAAGVLADRGVGATAVVRATFGMHMLLAVHRLQTDRPAGEDLVGQVTDLHAVGLSSGKSLRSGRTPRG